MNREPLSLARCPVSRALRGLVFGIGTTMAGAVPGGEIALGPPAGQVELAGLPDFAQLEALGARIGAIRIVNRNIFDTTNPAEDKLLFRAANALHPRTRARVIEAALLFRSGDAVSASRIEETERLLRGTRYLYEVRIRPIALRDGVVDIEVETRDAWTLDLGVGLGRSGGANSSSVSLQEYNLLGSGIALGIGRFSNVDRSGSEFQVSTDRAFGTWTAIAFGQASNDDGRRQVLRVVRPFHALDARWSAGFSASLDNRIDPVYRAGQLVAEYRRRENLGEVFGGWSSGLVDGRVRRVSIGLQARDDAWAPEPGRVAPPSLPADATLAGPFVRLELIEDRFEKTSNLNQIGRSEFLPMGLAASAQLGRSAGVFGADRDAWLYQGAVSRGFEPRWRHRLLASASISGRLSEGRVERQRLGAQAQYYLPHDHRRLFYAALSADLLTHPAPLDTLLLGGDNGLRGYPLRYLSGDRRVLLTLEERFYTDPYWFQLFRVGAAAFLDVGRAWGGDPVTLSDRGWVANAGIGLRIFNVRAAFSNVVHLDIAVPLMPADGISRVQFLVRTRASF